MPGFGDSHASETFEVEGFGYDADGEGAGFFGYLRDSGRGAGAGSAAHAAGDEDHVGFAYDFVEVFPALLGGLGAQFGHTSDALALGELVADADLDGDVASDERLRVGVDYHVVHAGDALSVHSGDGVGAAAADAHDFDAGDALVVTVIGCHTGSPIS